MGGDYTRLTFDPTKNFSGVLMQQGRVQLDADWNELVEILDRRLRAETTDVVGRAGVPNETPDGFKITLPGDGTMKLAPGRMYVDGLLAETHGPTTNRGDDGTLGELRSGDPIDYLDQPFLPDPPALPTGVGPHIVYLDVWQREVGAYEEPDLIEAAIGVDTATRLQTIWQVRVLEDVGADVTCQTKLEAIPKWGALIRPSGGRLTTAAVGVPTPDDPCVISPNGGYRGLENRLYRVEIQEGGAPGPGGATFKWSRDNGSVVTAVTDIDANLTRLTVANTGRDSDLGFSGDEWVEVVDDRLELDRQPGLLRQVDRVDPFARAIVLKSALPAGVFDPSKPERHTRVRRWDHGAQAGADGTVPVPAAGTPFVLEQGVQVTFDTDGTGAFQAGDHWLFAARTADGTIQHLEQAPPRGVRHHFARLATISPPSTSDDCRSVYLRLTEIKPFGGSCTITLRPNDDLQAAVDALPPDGARVCLVAGEYQLRAPLRFQGKNRIVFSGAGPSTRLRALNSETAVAFIGCTEVEVRALRAEGGTPTEPDEQLNGAISFSGCDGVTVSECTISCPDFAARTQTCVTVRPDPQAGLSARVRIERNRLEVGAWQTGILLVNLARSVVAGNELRMPGSEREVRAVAAGPDPIAPLVGSLLDHIRARPSGRTVALRLAGTGGSRRSINVLESAPLTPVLREFARSEPARGVKRTADVAGALREFVEPLAAGAGLSSLPAEARAGLAERGAAPRSAGQGIVVAGAEVGTVEILDNVVEDAVQGIHIGVSSPDTAGRESADAVLISRNVVRSLVPVGYDAERHAVFVGNARSVHILDTIASLERTGSAAETAPTPVDAIVVHGVLGPFLLVRETSTRGFRVGVSVTPLDPVPAARMWLVAETMANASLGASAPSTVEQQHNFPVAARASAIVLTDASGATTVGQEWQVTATVSDQFGNVVQDAVVGFTATGANTASGSATTDAAGQAKLAYTGQRVGGDRVTAWVDLNANRRQDPGEPNATVQASFVPDAPASLVLVPQEGASGVNQAYTVTARLVDALRNPTPNVRVVFEVRGANQVEAVTQTTNASGEAAFQYTPTTAGDDAISAFADVDEDARRKFGEPSGVAQHSVLPVAENPRCLEIRLEIEALQAEIADLQAQLRGAGAAETARPGIAAAIRVAAEPVGRGLSTSDKAAILAQIRADQAQIRQLVAEGQRLGCS